MAIDFLYPQYEVVRNNDRCINCRACERQCANEVHLLGRRQQPHAGGRVQVRQLPPLRVALPDPCAENRKDRPHVPRERKLDRRGHLRGLPPGRHGRRAAVLDGQPEPATRSTGIRFSSTLRRSPTRPSTRCASRWRPRPSSAKSRARFERDENGRSVPNLAPQLELNLPIMFSAMSYGSISYNAHARLARAAKRARHLL